MIYGRGESSSNDPSSYVFHIGLGVIIVALCVGFGVCRIRKKRREMQIVGTPVQPPCIVHVNPTAYVHTNHPAPQYQPFLYVAPSSPQPSPVAEYPLLPITTSPPQPYPLMPQPEQHQQAEHPPMPTPTTTPDQLPPAYSDTSAAPLPIPVITSSVAPASSSTFPPVAASTLPSSAPYPDPLNANREST